MKEVAACTAFTPVKLPATIWMRQSIGVQFPTAILKNFPAFLAYVDGIRAETAS
jgi:hypothetical protein